MVTGVPARPRPGAAAPAVYATARGGLRARLGSAAAARARARRHDLFLRTTGVTPASRIVDVGCGPLGLRAHGPELDVTGVDLAPRPDYPGTFVQADATERLPFADGAFDLAYSNSVIEHLPPARREAFAARAHAGRAGMVGADAGLRLPDRAALAAAGRPLAAAPPPAGATGGSAWRARTTSTSCAGASSRRCSAHR